MICRACGGKTGETIKTTDYMLTNKQFIYEVCQDCGTWQIQTIPDNIGEYYSKDYYSYESKESPQSIAHFRRVAKIIIKEFKLTEKSSVLDYGAGAILLLKALYSEGVGEDGQLHRLRAFDKFAPVTEWKGIKLQNELPTDIKFDFVLSKHCLEHEIDPVIQIDNILRLLTKDGVGHIVVPNPDSIEAEYWKGHWIGIDAPRHLNILTLKAITQLVNKCGGEVIKSETIPEPTNYLTSEAYRKGLRWKDRDKYISDTTQERLEELYCFTSVLSEMGKADCLTVTIRRK
jgi:SAM-dependent methyltransferase